MTVPEYMVTERDGFHHVAIENGEMYTGDGDMGGSAEEIPFIVEAVDLPPGVLVKDVQLLDKGDMSTATGLYLPPFSAEIDSQKDEGAAPAESALDDPWYPRRDFSWDAHPNPGGGTHLVIRVYPFKYNPRTTQVRFYRRFVFAVQTHETDISIRRVRTDKPVYGLGETVRVLCDIENLGQPQDVIAKVQILPYGSGEPISGLSLRALSGLEGVARYAPIWGSEGQEPGHYIVRVILSDLAERPLSEASARFTLGVSLGKLTHLTVAPRRFSPGEMIALSIGFLNRGDLLLRPTAVVSIQDAQGQEVRQYAQDLGPVGPGQDTSRELEWDTSGVVQGAYRVVGHVRYDGTATLPRSVYITTDVGGEVVLPLVMRAG